MNVLAVIFVMGMTAGLAAWLLPERWWKAVAGNSRRANQTSCGALVFFSGMLGLGLWIFAVNAGEFLQAWESNGWRETTGRIVDGRVVETTSIRSSNPAFRVRADYDYEVAGKSYRGGRLAFGNPSTGDREWVEEQLRTVYAKGTELPVFYDPEKPWESVLKPGWGLIHGIHAALALVLTGVGAHSLRMLWMDWEG